MGFGGGASVLRLEVQVLGASVFLGPVRRLMRCFACDAVKGLGGLGGLGFRVRSKLLRLAACMAWVWGLRFNEDP